ncbi:MAG: flavodoxin family protein [Planctomycetota bacterium]|jgi:multimeric flavodoxin WrbA
MKVLGISCSPRSGQTTDQLVKAVLDAVDGAETEFLSLAGKQICPCIACLGCVKTNVCVLKDDLKDLRAKIVEADALVVGGPNFFKGLNGIGRCFLERFYQFRHREQRDVAGKLGVAVGVGGGDPKPVVEDIRTFFQYNQIECVADVVAQGVACCFTCGFGETCKVGAIHMFFGEGTKITDEITPSLAKQPECLAAAKAAGKTLSDRLKTFAAGT